MRRLRYESCPPPQVLRELRVIFEDTAEPGTDATPPPWPFATESARRVWDVAQKLAMEMKLLASQDILYRAVEDSKVSAADLTPEDMKLLQMAIDWIQNGPAKPSGRDGNGGPFGAVGP